MRIYHHHKGTPDFQKRLSYVLDHDGQKVQYAVVQHLFEGGNEIPVIITTYGNTINKKASYRRTQKSTLSRIKQIPGNPKYVVSVYMMKLVEVWGASSASELPRNRRQIYNSKYTTIVRLR